MKENTFGVGENKVIVAGQWLIVLREGEFYKKFYSNLNKRQEAVTQLDSGALPLKVLGRLNSLQTKYHSVRTIEWVPDESMVLMGRWLFKIETAAESEQLFENLRALFPHAADPELSRLNVLCMNLSSQTGVALLSIVGGMIAMIGGAVDGVSGANLRFRFFAKLGQGIGLTGVIGIGAILFVVGGFWLYRLYQVRPWKYVVRINNV